MKNLLFLFLLLGVLAATIGHAHQPLWNEASPNFASSYQVEEIKVSKAIFGDLNAGELDVYKLDVPGGYQLNISLFKGNCKTFNPKLWLAQEGEQVETNASFKSLDLPEGYAISEVEATEWRDYNGHGLKGYKGTGVSEFLNGTVYLIVEAGEESGVTLLSLAGLEIPGGSPEGRDATGRFNRCQMN